VRGQRKNGKIPADGGTTYQEDHRPGRAREDPGEGPTTECCTGQHRLERVVDSDDRKRQRRVENGRGSAPEVSCNPQPSIRDHHLRFREKLTARNYVEVVVESKLLKAS